MVGDERHVLAPDFASTLRPLLREEDVRHPYAFAAAAAHHVVEHIRHINHIGQEEVAVGVIVRPVKRHAVAPREGGGAVDKPSPVRLIIQREAA